MDDNPERPVSREEAREQFQTIKDAVDDFLESGDDERLVPTKGGTVRLTRDPDAHGGIRVSAEGLDELMDNRTYNAPMRPESYPEDIPFLPDTNTMVTHIPGRGLFSVTWIMLDEPETRFDEIEEWHAAAGWVEVGDHPDQEARLETAREKMAQSMKSRGMSDEEAAEGVDAGIEMARSARRVRLGKDGATRGISVMSLPDGRGVITLFAKAPETEG